MRLHILGKNNDDKGTQLEVLTKEILESLGYQRLKLNVANDAGELDVQGELVTPLPIENRITKVIAECKAHKEPLNMTDWLKFLGKIFIAESNNEDIAGCLVALSGVNGNVLGSKESLNRRNIRLVESATLVEYLEKSHDLASWLRIQQYLASMGRRYLSIDLAYYHRRVYWIVSYDDGKYTVLEADGTYPTDPTLDLIRPMVEAGLEVGSFLDLRKEESSRRSRLFAKKLIFLAAMIGNGSATFEDTAALLELPEYTAVSSHAVIQQVLDEIIQAGMMQMDEAKGHFSFCSNIETDLEARRQLFVEFGQEILLIRALECEWWDSHVDEKLMGQACTIQANLQLNPDDQKKATQAMRLSPTALMYAIFPDPMIVTHHKDMGAVPATEDMLLHDRRQFMRSLYNGLIKDFRNHDLSRYFFCQRRIEALAQKTKLVVYGRDDTAIIDDEVEETTMIGEWHEKDTNGNPIYLHVAALPDFAKRRRGAALEQEKARIAAERIDNADTAPKSS